MTGAMDDSKNTHRKEDTKSRSRKRTGRSDISDSSGDSSEERRRRHQKQHGSSSDTDSGRSPKRKRKRAGKDDKTEKKKKKSSKRAKRKSRKTSPVQLSKFLEGDAKYSSVSGKKIKLKLEKSREDKIAEQNRQQLLAFLNASTD